MMSEVTTAQKHLKDKFGDKEVPNGDYAVPLRGKFMKVTISEGGYMSGFNLFKNKELTKEWSSKNR